MRAFLAVLVTVAALPAYGSSSTHSKFINMVGCRTVFDGTTAPFSDYIEYDTYSTLFDFATEPSWASGSTNSNLVCDFRLPDTTTLLSKVTLWARVAHSSGEAQPVLNVVVPFLYLHVATEEWNAYSQGSCTVSTTTTATNGVRSCNTTLGGSGYSMVSSGAYSNYSAYAVLSWSTSACSGGCSTYGYPDIMQIEVDYTTSP